MKEIATALAKAQANLKVADKSSVNPHFKSKYADLAEVWDACREALTSEGLSVVQLVQRGEQPYLRTILLHSSGESIESETPLFLPSAPTMQHHSLEANGVEEWAGIWSMVAIIQTCFLRRPEGMKEYESLLKASLEDFKEKWERR